MERGREGDGRGAFRALRTRNYRLFFVGQVLSVIGTWIQGTAIAWIVLRSTGDPTALGAIVALQFLPLLLLGAYAGMIADRHDKRRILVAANAAAALVALGTALLVSNGADTVLALGPMTLLLGVTTAFEMPTRQSFVAQIVAPADIPSAVGLNGAVMTGSRVVGTAIAGLFIAVLGASVCLYVNAASFLAIIVALLLMRRDEMRSVPPLPRARRQIRAGLRYALQAPEVRFPLLAMAVVGTFSLNQPVLVPLLARFTFDAGPGLFALFGAVGAFGAFSGSLTSARVMSSTVAGIGRAALGFGVIYCATAFAPWAWLTLIGLAGSAFCAALYVAWTNARLQQESEDAYRGRVMALYTIVFLGSTPIGSILMSAVAEASSPRVAVFCCGVAAAGTGVVALLRVRRLARAARAPRSARDAPRGVDIAGER